MKLEQQVTSLELSKRLKELGVKQISAFYWTVPKSDTSDVRASLEAYSVDQNWLDGMIKKIAAFTVAELGEMLPDGVHTKHLYGDWIAVYQKDGHIQHTIESPTEADARAKMLVYLLDNKLITLP